MTKMKEPMRQPNTQHITALPPTAILWAAGFVWIGLLMVLAPSQGVAHPGDLDEYGGHFDPRNSEYHYHRPKPEMAQRKKEHLTWIQRGHVGELRGDVAKIERPDALWVYIAYRPAYQEFANLLSPSSRDDKNQRVLVWFQHVSPEGSVTQGKTYRQWFHKKVVYELDQKLRGKRVAIQFRVVPSANRLKGIVNLGKESINLWLLLNGWSYYLLPQNVTNPADKQYRQAESVARTKKLGLWKTAK